MNDEIQLSDNVLNQLNQIAIQPNIGAVRANKFWQYFINTIFEGQFIVRMWNHYENRYERTNNRAEDDNNKMKLFCGASNPSYFIW